MNTDKIRELAEYLNNAELNRQEVIRITDSFPELSFEEGYQIQKALIDLKITNGYKVMGYKMGMTSKAKMQQMKLENPIYGVLMDYMLLDGGNALRLGDLIHPKVEPEIAFIMGKDVKGPGITSKEVFAAIDYVLPVMEIIDSRFKDFKFTMSDVLADNCSSARVVIGNRIKKLDGINLDLLGVSLEINGQIVDFAAGAAVLGHPVNPVVMLANMLADKGEYIPAGSLILTGGVTKAVQLKVGDVVTTKVEKVGDVSFYVTE